jgi:hypothetical protein
MTLEELISLFIPKNLFFQGTKPSKVALPCSKATKRQKLERRVRCCSSEVCYERGVAPLFIQGLRLCWRLNLVRSPLVSTASACPHATSRQRVSREELAGVARPWPGPSPPPLHGGLVLGPRLLLGWYSSQIVVMDGPLYLFFVQISIGKHLLVNSLHVFVLVSCKTIISKYMWN